MGITGLPIELVAVLPRKELPKALNWRSSMSTTEAASKVFEEIAELFGSGPTDEQIFNFRPSADVVQRASQLLSLKRTGQNRLRSETRAGPIRASRAFDACGKGPHTCAASKLGPDERIGACRTSPLGVLFLILIVEDCDERCI